MVVLEVPVQYVCIRETVIIVSVQPSIEIVLVRFDP
jgi:hypothetical protein